MLIDKQLFYTNLTFDSGIAIDMHAIGCKFWTEAKDFRILQKRNHTDLRF